MRRYRGVDYAQHCWIIGFLLISVLLMAACGSPGSGSSTTPSQPVSTPVASPTQLTVVHIKIVAQGTKYAFVPATLTVKAGTQVIWTNNSNAPHTVTSDTGVFNTSTQGINFGQTYSFTFTKPGTYAYYCNIHTYMTGKIIVTT